MKKNWLFIAALVVIAFALGYVSPIGTVYAQGSGPTGSSFTMSSSGAVPCPTPTANMIAFCGSSTGLLVSSNGGAYQAGVGQAATITVGSVTTLPAGSSATVTNSGTTSAMVLNFGIPQGAQGAQGNQGVPGIPGTIQSKITCTGFTFNGTQVQLSGCQ